MSKVIRAQILLGALMAATYAAKAAPLRLTVHDESGAAFANVLVILQSLDGRGEQFRALTGKDGAVPEHDLEPGLYRVIATCPYGVCETRVEEILIGAEPVQRVLQLPIRAISGNRVTIGGEKLQLHVVTASGNPAAKVAVLVRDRLAENEQWYRTNGLGNVVVQLPNRTNVVLVVADQKIFEREVTQSQAKSRTLTIRLP